MFRLRRTPANNATTRHVGSIGEHIATKHLKKNHYRILSRNTRVPMGEADIIALAPDKQTIVLIEVKSRITKPNTPPSFRPESNITAHKQHKLRAIITHLAKANQWQSRPLRIDVIAIEFAPGPRPLGKNTSTNSTDPTLRHHQAAIKLPAR